MDAGLFQEIKKNIERNLERRLLRKVSCQLLFNLLGHYLISEVQNFKNICFFMSIKSIKNIVYHILFALVLILLWTQFKVTLGWKSLLKYCFHGIEQHSMSIRIDARQCTAKYHATTSKRTQSSHILFNNIYIYNLQCFAIVQEL